MLYLNYFEFPSGDQEFDVLINIKRKCYNTFYPFKILAPKSLTRLDFEPITILYGGNGSGKTTALNVIANKLDIERESVYNQSNFFQDYVDLCKQDDKYEFPEDSRIITSDDVFDYMLNIRNLNNGIHTKREEVFEDFLEAKYSKFKMTSLEDYEELKKVNQAKRFTQSKFTRNQLAENIPELSNGESGFMFFTEKVKENGLYLLDEPENSLSPNRQLELAKFIEDSARFYQCQFIISTHSPFMLALKGAKIYDLDDEPVTIKKWTELSNVKVFYDFFKKHEEEF